MPQSSVLTLMPEIIGQFLVDLGVSPKMTGYYYLLTGVQIYLDYDKPLPPLLTKDIYPALSAIYGRSDITIDRCSRWALHKAYDVPGAAERWWRLLGTPPASGRTCYSVMEFISLVGVRIRDGYPEAGYGWDEPDLAG